MLTLDYLRTIIGGKIDGLTDTTEQVMESDAGYDGIIELIQTKGLPLAMVLEPSEMGNFSFRPGGFHITTQSVWIMEMVGADETRRAVQQRCFTALHNLLVTLKDHKDDSQLEGWDWLDIPYGVRNAGPNYTGYEVFIRFTEDTDLADLITQ